MIIAVLLIAGFATLVIYWDQYKRYARIRSFSPTEEMAAWVQSMHSVRNIQNWVAENIEYKSDRELWGKADFWATPAETWNLRAGDCDSIHIFMAWAVYELLGLPTYLLIINKSWLLAHGVMTYRDGEDWVLINYRQTKRGPTEEGLLPLILYIQDGCPDPRPYTYISQKWEIPSGKRIL